MASTDEHWDPVFEVPAGFVDALFRLDGRVAAVTGGGSGLGQAMAVGLAQAGASVAVLDVNDEGARTTVEAVEADGGRALAVACDVTDSAAVNAAADWVVGALGRV